MFSMVSNFLEIKSTMNNLSFNSKRFQALPAHGIGSWLQIGEMLTLASVGVNCAIIFFTSEALDSILEEYRSSKLYQFMIIVLIEHVIIVFKFGLAVVIKDKPNWVIKEEQELYENQDQLYAMLEAQKAEFKANGGELLEDQIAEIKDQQRRKATKNILKAKTSKSPGLGGALLGQGIKD